ncbi:MAG: heme-binding protein [Roseovarius sp.]|uniref:heme-binding protein n=1 Tax=Roseovarius sp. TaxID=1486281 RepID=UPI0032EC4931
MREVALARSGLPLTASKGGVFVRDAGGKVLGAVGVAGEAGDYDEAFAVAGIEAAGFVADAG